MDNSHQPSHSTLETVVLDYSTLEPHQRHSTLEVGYQTEGGLSDKQIAAKDGLEVGSEPVRSQGHTLASKRNLLILAVAVTLLVLGAVLGGVLGTQLHKHSATTDATTAGTAPTSPNSSNSSATHSTPPPLSQRNIAAVSFLSSSRNGTRLYFQDDAGHILQGSNDERNRVGWKFGNLGGSAKLGSPLAAAVSRPRFPLARISRFPSITISNS
jgi:hypothetical protein